MSEIVNQYLKDFMAHVNFSEPSLIGKRIVLPCRVFVPFTGFLTAI